MKARYETVVTRMGQAKPHAAIYDTTKPENVFDPEGGRWVLVCEAHGQLVNVRTLRDAHGFADDLDSWCDGGPHEGEAER